MHLCHIGSMVIIRVVEVTKSDLEPKSGWAVERYVPGEFIHPGRIYKTKQEAEGAAETLRIIEARKADPDVAKTS